jgi:hypothetical protein
MRSWKTQWTSCKILFQKTENIEFFQFAIFSDRVHMDLRKVQVTLNWDILSSIHNVNFIWGLISFIDVYQTLHLKFWPLFQQNNLALKFENDNFSLKLHFKLWTFH